MNTTELSWSKKNKRLLVIIAFIAVLLVIPLVAMQFTNDVNWTLSDFIVAAILLFGTGFLCELTIRKINKVKFKIAVCVIILTGLIIIWAELAVGIFGTPLAGS